MEESEEGSYIPGSPGPAVAYKDMATWTVEDDMPSPMDSSTPLDSPDLSQLRRYPHYSAPPPAPSQFEDSPKKSGPCFTVSSQLLCREARLYENVAPALALQPEFLSVSEFLQGGGPPSRSSWVDSGRESLSLDGETPNNSNSNNSNSSKTVGPSPQATGRLKGSGLSRRDRLVRQKQAIEETFCPIPGAGSPTGPINSMCSYLAVPSPRRGVLGSGILQNSALAAASPISLHRHPNSQQALLQENKKTRSLIPGCESPYAFNSGERRGGTGGGAYGGRQSRSPSRGLNSGTRAGGQYTGGGQGRALGRAPQSFDYGELPSHQMFPKRHLLSGRQFSSPYGNHSSNHSNGVPPPLNLQAQQQSHRSFPAGLLSGVAPRSCSMGDLSGSPRKTGPEAGNAYDQQTVPITNTPAGIHSSLVTSLPLPPATSVTYEFSLAPVSGTLAPGWHLTAVQRGLATAVPLAAVVARRRLPRPRPPRQRFGFTDKNEARRAKWTILVTALALLAMSMLLVGITLRLAPLIDDLVRKENEDLLRGIVQTASSLNVTSPASATSDLTSTQAQPSLNNHSDPSNGVGEVAIARERRMTTTTSSTTTSTTTSASRSSSHPSLTVGSTRNKQNNKIASLTLSRNRTGSPAPLKNLILQQLRIHSSYYETSPQVGPGDGDEVKISLRTRDSILDREAEIEDQDEAGAARVQAVA